jgi:Macrocin-O-methyltransferase (TylF)
MKKSPAKSPPPQHERQFDGRANFPVDDEVEALLEAHFQKYSISKREIWRNFQIYSRRLFLKRFLAHYELFRKTIHLPGDIVELGVYRGASLFSWANFLEIRNMGDRAKKVIGFDNFFGFKELDPKDGPEYPRVGKVPGGFDGGTFKQELLDAISIYDRDRFIGYKPRVEIVDGNVEESVAQYLKSPEGSGMRISLLHFDCDLYRPTKAALALLWPLVVKGGVVIFDEYSIRPWEGESNAVDEFFDDKDVIFRKFDWSTNPGAYVIK